jgi:excinuclease ABC subunit A
LKKNYILDKLTTGLHPANVEKLIIQLDKLIIAGNTVIVVEHDMKVVTESDYIIDMGPGAGDEGGKVVATGAPEEIVNSKKCLTAKYLNIYLGKKS